MQKAESTLKPKNWNEEDLIRAYQNGMREAFLEIYRRLGPKVLGYLKKKGLSSAEAEDVTQEVFIKLHRNRHHIEPQMPLSPWVFTVARNALVDHLRKQRPEEVALLEQDQMQDATSHSAVEFEDLTKDLPERLKNVVHWRYVEDLSFDEIAARLEVSEQNARQLVSRAVRSLRQVLKRSPK